MEIPFWEAVKLRRSLYGFDNGTIVPQQRIEKILADALIHVPSAYNSQSTRLILLFGTHHKRLWDITLNALKKKVGKQRFEKTRNKINEDFASGYGTILFFEDTGVVDALAQRFPSYAKTFPVWSQHTNAMHQYVVWTALAAQGLGASLQHYNPLIDDAVKKEWDIPKGWQLIAQMPFGQPVNPPGEKDVLPLDARLRVHR